MGPDYPRNYRRPSVGSVRKITQTGGWFEYERRKREWQDANQDAAPAEYEAAMRRISDELGL